MNAAMFGAIYPGQEETYARVVRNVADDVDPSSIRFWQCQLDTNPLSSVINLTSFGVDSYQIQAPTRSNHFDIVVGSSPESLCTYWNFRATREMAQGYSDLARRTLLLPITLVTDEAAMVNLVRFLRDVLPHRNIMTNLHVRFQCWDSSDHDTMQHMLSSLSDFVPFTGKVSINETSSSFEQPEPETFTARPLSYMITLPDLPHAVLEGVREQFRTTITLSYGKNEFIFVPPELLRSHPTGGVMLDFICDVWKRYPRIQELSTLIVRDSWFSKYGISMMVHFVASSQYLSFSLPDEWTTVSSYFSGRGYGILESKSGRYADAVVRLVGSLNGVELLASKAVYLLLDKLTLKSTMKIAQRVAAILGVDAARVDDIRAALAEFGIDTELKGHVKAYKELRGDEDLKDYRSNLLALLERLCECQVVRRGYYLDCPHCGAADWYPLTGIEERLVCSGCGRQFMLPVEWPRGSRDEAQWRYRLNTLANRAIDQDVLPNILALYRVAGRKGNEGSCCKVIGLELAEDGKLVAEVDFMLVANSELVAGECKAGDEIGEKDVRTAVRLAEAGVKQFYFCTVRSFNEPAKRRIDELRELLESKGLPMEVAELDGEELLGERLAP